VISAATDEISLPETREGYLVTSDD